jgi:hypothetical protein
MPFSTTCTMRPNPSIVLLRETPASSTLVAVLELYDTVAGVALAAAWPHGGDSPRSRSPFSFGTDRDSPLKSITVLLGTRSVFSRQSDHFSRPRPTVIDNGRILIGMGGD